MLFGGRNEVNGGVVVALSQLRQLFLQHLGAVGADFQTALINFTKSQLYLNSTSFAERKPFIQHLNSLIEC